MEAKFCRESRAVQTHRILPFHCNMHQTLYGGQLMEFLDNCASITVSRHPRSLCVTASMDQLNFIRPLHLSDSVCVETIVTGTGRTSVEVFAKVVGERLETGERYLAATAFLTFVAIDETGASVEVAPIQPEGPEEIFVCAGYPERQAKRMAERQASAQFQSGLNLDFPWDVH